MTISSLVLDLPDASFVVARLLKTATDMGESLRPFWGPGSKTRKTYAKQYPNEKTDFQTLSEVGFFSESSVFTWK